MILYGKLVKLTEPCFLQLSTYWSNLSREYGSVYPKTKEVRKVHPWMKDSATYDVDGFILPIGTVVILTKIYADQRREFVEAKTFNPVTKKLNTGITLRINSAKILEDPTAEEAAPYVHIRNIFIANKAANGLEAALQIDRLCS